MVRYLLHRVRRPHELVDVPLARAIGRALGTDNATEALLRVLEAALPGDAPSEIRLRKLVLEYDFDSGSISQVCTTMGISRRHLLRLRSEAVTAMAYFIRKLLAAESLDFSDADDMSENQIANLAEIVANSEPEKGATIYELGGLGSSTASQLLRLRSAIDQGSGLSAKAAAQFQNLPDELVQACIAFSRESNGEPASDDVPGWSGDARRRSPIYGRHEVRAGILGLSSRATARPRIRNENGRARPQPPCGVTPERSWNGALFAGGRAPATGRAGRGAAAARSRRPIRFPSQRRTPVRIEHSP